MAMLASKTPYPAALGGSSGQSSSAAYGSGMSSYRARPAAAGSASGLYASPTESEFSEAYDAPDSIRQDPATISRYAYANAQKELG